MTTKNEHESKWDNAVGIIGIPPRPSVTVRPVVTIQRPVTQLPLNTQIIRPTVTPTLPLVNPTLPLYPPTGMGGGGGSAPAPQPEAAVPMTKIVVQPAQYFERVKGIMVDMKGKEGKYPQAVIDTAQKIRMRNHKKYTRVLRMIDENGEPSDSTRFANNKPRYIYVKNWQVSDDQNAAYDSADGGEEKKSAETKTTDKPTSQTTSKTSMMPKVGAVTVAATLMGMAFGIGFAKHKKYKTSTVVGIAIAATVLAAGIGAGLDNTVFRKK